MPHSPHSLKRASLPPFSAPGPHTHFESYKASPLARALTPPPPSNTDLEPFPSVESSLESAHTHSTSQSSGHNFHMHPSGLSQSNSSDMGVTSPIYAGAAVQIYCAGCHRPSVLRDSYACTECISGFCSDCVYKLSSASAGASGGGGGRPCPRCGRVGTRYKPFQLDFR